MLYSKFIQHSNAMPDKTALVWQETLYSYPELAAASEVLAVRLQRAGLQPNNTVAVLIPNSPQFIAGALAIWACGCAILPLNVAYTRDEINQFTKAADVNYIIADCDAKTLIPAEVEHKILLDTACPLDTTHGSGFNRTIVPGTSKAAVMFSSGSTGIPKQVVRSQANLAAELGNAKSSLNVSDADTIFCCVPLFHAHGFGNCFMAALLNGGTLVLSHGEFNGRKVANEIAKNQATIFPGVPFMCKILALTSFKTKPDFSSLRLAYTAGAALEKDIYDNFSNQFGVALGQLYGSTETGAVTINIKPSPGNWQTVGLPLANTSIRLVDDSGQEVSPGEAGEIVINTAAMATEYTDLPELSATTFQADGYHTGDLGIFNGESQLRILGRKKLMINVAGNKVDPADVENVISQIPGVQEVVALGKPDELYGETIKVAIVAGKAVTRETVQNHCAENLVEYKVPKIIDFIDEIPKSPLGKVLRKYL